MPAVMGNQRAALKLYTGEWITADEAVECGLALRAVEPEELMDVTLELARPHRQDADRLAARRRKSSSSRAVSTRVRAARAREDVAFRSMIGQPANMEAIAAFLEKRDPDFSEL